MKKLNLTLIALTVVLLSACASQSTKTNDSSSETTKEKASPAEKAKSNNAEGTVIGTPARGSKFAKLKLGMPMLKAVELIGAPTDQSRHPTGKAAIPFYFGPDRWVIECFYKGEGRLTFNQGEDQVLTLIEVNTAQQ